MTSEELKSELAGRGLTDCTIRETDNAGAYRVNVERQHNGRHCSHSVLMDKDPSTRDIDQAARKFKQWWDDVRDE